MAAPAARLSPWFSSWANAWQPASVTLQVQNNSEAVKNIIRRNYPGLTKDLDAAFVYRPVQ
jgi:hypothetical protein